MKSVNFGISTKFRDLVQKEPSIALRESTVLVTWGEADNLYYRVGQVAGAAVNFSSTGPISTGVQSTCGLARSQGFQGNLYAINVHKSENNEKLYAEVRRVDGSTIGWRSATEFADGKDPSVAINNSLYAVEVHSDADGDQLRYHVGSVTVQRNAEQVTWTPAGNGTPLSLGQNPSVAMNDANQVLLAWESGGSLRFRRGALAAGALVLSGSEQPGPAGSNPAVALDSDGTAILLYRDSSGKLRYSTGKVDDPVAIFPADDAGTEFESGVLPAVASHGGKAAQIHQSQIIAGSLYYSTSLVTNRSTWMKDRLKSLGDKNLGQLALPASHDAGIYTVLRNDPTGAALAQSLDLFGQLSQGCRYFDLRPRWDNNSTTFNLYHDIEGNGDAIGPRLAQELDDVARFLKDNPELAILKFSHYQNFETDVEVPADDPANGKVPAGATPAQGRDIRSKARYKALTELIVQNLDGYLYMKPNSESRRLAKIPLDDYIKNRNKGLALVVCDGDFPVDNPVEGIYVYRDTGASPKGDLQVYDRYYETAGDSYLLLLGDQKGKYNDYHGQDDLFLLSWTLTPIPTIPAGETVLKLSAEPNQKLASAITEFPTAVNKQVNLVYINYVDTARATDVCLYLNGAPHAD